MPITGNRSNNDDDVITQPGARGERLAWHQGLGGGISLRIAP